MAPPGPGVRGGRAGEGKGRRESKGSGGECEAPTGITQEEDDQRCGVCGDWSTDDLNSLVQCSGCEVFVHQACE